MSSGGRWKSKSETSTAAVGKHRGTGWASGRTEGGKGVGGKVGESGEGRGGGLGVGTGWKPEGEDGF
jgi:hypothetical protein